MSDKPSFFAELKRRNVYKVAVAYAVVGWLLIQIATQVFPFFEIPNWAVRLIVLLILVGFPIALIIAWAFELTPDGLRRTESGDETPTEARSRAWIYVVLIAAALSIGLFFLGRYTAQRTSLTEDERPGGPSLSPKSIAVLPFENLSEEKTNAYFADGIQDEILTRLAKIKDLKVISRTSTQRYKSVPESLSEIGRQLGVANILEGSVQKSGDQVRVNVQLIKTANDSHLWAETYDRELHDIFRVATAVADKLQATLSGREEQVLRSEPTGNLDAYDAYLHGLDYDRRSESTSDLQKATEYLALAVKLDPNFALAWARLGRVKANLYFQDVDTTPAWREATRAAVQRAVSLAPDLGETSLAVGYFQFFCERKLALARSAFEAARARLPNDSDLLLALSLVDLTQGRAEEALALEAQALQLDPRNPFLFFRKALALSSLRRFPEARAAFDFALVLNPNDPELLGYKASTYEAEGNLKQALQILDQLPVDRTNAIFTQVGVLGYDRRYADIISILRPIVEEFPASTDLRIAYFYDFLGRAEKFAGDPIAARASFSKGRDLVLANLAKSGGPQGRIHAVLASLYAGLGEKEDALREANRAVELEGDDRYYAPSAREILARVEVQVGDPSRALDLLPGILDAHYFSWVTGVPLTTALLRLDPVWDPMRDDPRFKALLAKHAVGEKDAPR